jgi:two-component system sensor histidine kinase ChiS
VDHAVAAAIGLRSAVAAFNAERRERGEADIQIGVGVHTGPLLLGAIGDASRMAVTMLSDIVNTTQRLEALTKVYGVGIVASEQVVRGISDPTRFWFRYLGSVQVKGKTEPVSVYEVFDGDLDDEIAAVKRATRADFEEGLRLYYARKFAQAGECFQRVLARTDDRAAQLYARRAHENLVQGTPPDWLGIEVLSEA